MPGPATFTPDHRTAREVHGPTKRDVTLPYREIRGPQDRVGRIHDDDRFESKPGGDSQ